MSKLSIYSSLLEESYLLCFCHSWLQLLHGHLHSSCGALPHSHAHHTKLTRAKSLGDPVFKIVTVYFLQLVSIHTLKLRLLYSFQTSRNLSVCKYIFCRLNVVNWMANILSLVVVVRMHTCMHAEVCSVLVTASCVWNVDKYLVA